MNNTEPCRLHPETGLSCGPTAVCAVTGASPEQVLEAIIEAAGEDDEHPEHLDDTNFRHQARTVERLGFDLFDTYGNKMRARDILLNRDLPCELNKLPKMADFLKQNESQDVLLCSGCRLKAGALEIHSFAVDRNFYVDNNTGGEVRQLADFPCELSDFRILDVLIVRSR